MLAWFETQRDMDHFPVQTAQLRRLPRRNGFQLALYRGPLGVRLEGRAEDDHLVVGVKSGQTTAHGQRVQDVVLIGRQLHELTGSTLAAIDVSYALTDVDKAQRFLAEHKDLGQARLHQA